jgi:hypothetical protein
MHVLRGIHILDGLMDLKPIVLRALPCIAEWIKITALVTSLLDQVAGVYCPFPVSMLSQLRAAAGRL